MRIALVTNCTSRKALPPACRAATVKARTLPAFARQWLQRIEKADAQLPTCDLYLGRGFQEARAAWREAKKLGHADLYVASAGLGIVSANEKAPSYSITVAARGEDSVVEKLGLDDATKWWDALTAGRRSLLARCNHADLIVVALSTPYLHMMRHELRTIAKAEPKRLRLIARNDPGSEDEALTPFWMAYDDRLNGSKSPIAGAESDFAQRALRHFIEYVLPSAPNAGVRAHADAVQATLSVMSKPRRKRRTRMTDEEIIALMREIGHHVGSTRMLRILRDEKNVACEQSRSSALFQRAFGAAKTKTSRRQSKKDTPKSRRAQAKGERRSAPR